MADENPYIINKNDRLPSSLSSFFFYFIKKQPWAFTLFFLAPLALILETNILPYALKLVIDGISHTQTNRANVFSEAAPGLWLGGIAWFSLVLIIRLQNWWQAYVIPVFQAQIRMTLLDYLLKHSYQFFANNMSGSLANKVNDLPRAIEAIRMIICWNGIATLGAVSVALILMASINKWFAILLLIWVAVQTLVSLWFSHHINFISEKNAHDKSSLNGRIVDTLTNINAIKLFSRNRDELLYVNETQKSEANSNKKLINYMNIFRLALDIPASIMLLLMTYLLIAFWQRNLISIGDLVYIFSAFLAIMSQMWFLAHAMSDLFREVGVAKQALSLINIPIEITDADHATPLSVQNGKIEFEEVSFRYQQGTKVFNKKSVVISPKQRVGLVGYSGGGKTTFINLILRFYNLDSGRILIDNQDISQATQGSLRASISMIPQDPVLFHRSLYENIGYGKKNSTHDEIIEAAQKAHCHEFITRLPAGYHTLVGERGIKLSGGQRQRIAIARAILKNAPILILDEATSQLDSLTEELIQDSLLQLMQDKTTLVIAHRLSTLLHMDRILVFDKGRIVEEGDHHSLIINNGLYKAMWDAQIGGFLPEEISNNSGAMDK